MAVAFVASDIAGSTNGGFSATTAGVDTSGANLIYLAVGGWTGGALASVSDSNGNTWTALTGQSSISGAAVNHYYCLNPVVGPGHTFTATSVVSSNRYPTIGMLAFSGANGGVIHQNGAATNSATALATGNVVPTGSNALVISSISFLGSVSSVAVSGGTLALEDFVNYTATQNQGLATAYEIQPGGATNRDASWTWTTASGAAAPIVAFAPGGATILRGSAVFGENTTVSAGRAIAFGLNGSTNSHTEVGKFKVFGDQALTGYLELIESTAPSAVANRGRIWAEDNGSGKTRIMVQFGTGAAVQIAIEP